MGPSGKSHSNSNSYAIMAKTYGKLVGEVVHTHTHILHFCEYICMDRCICFPKNIAFSNQLNFNLHNFLYVKVMCSEFDYFPLNWAEDITSGLKVDKADDPRSSSSPVSEQTGEHTQSPIPSHPQTRSVGQDTGYVNMLTAKWVCHGVDKHYCRIYLYLNLCVGRWQG